MEKPRFYITSEDGQHLLDSIEDSRLTLPEAEQEEGNTIPMEPVTVKMDVKLDSETDRKLDEASEAFMNKREAGIKAVAEYFGISEEEIRKKLESVEAQLEMLMIPSINPAEIIHSYHVRCPELPKIEIQDADTTHHQSPREYGISRQSWRRNRRK